MARKPRIHIPGAFYHVTLRGNHRQDIFFCDAHRRWLDDIVAEAIQRFKARVHAYCWMSNHVHLLIQVGESPLGRVMLRIASMYARRVQRHLLTTGHLFERRYHAILVDADEYLLTLLRYIHLNPVRAGMVSTPDDYSWSSHAAYSGTAEKDWLTKEFAMRMLHADPASAIETYKRMMQDEWTLASPKPFDLLNPADRRVLGDDSFVAHAHGLAWRPKSHETIDSVIARICREAEIEIYMLKSGSRQRVLSRVRAQVAQYCLERRIASLSEVARRFGRDESSLREAVLRYFPPQ